MAIGYIIEISFVDFADKSANIDHWLDADYNWRDGLWQVTVLEPTRTSPVQFVAPVRVPPRQTGGFVGADPVQDAWGSCTELLMHV